MIRKLLAVLALSALAGSQVRATHISGGEIYWDCIGPNQYRITLTVYRDCAGINLNSSYNLNISSPCGNMTMNVSTPGGTEISQLCDIALPNSTCNGGTLPGTQMYVYTGVVTLPPCNSWTISWTQNWRNNAIVNLQAPGTQLMYIEATLNNIVAPCEDSPQFTNLAIPYVCLGYPISYSYGAYDVEGDSMVYSLIGARTTGGAPIPYVAPHTPTNPIPGLTLDPVTGQLNFTLNVAGNWVVVIQVDIYDAAGNFIGTIMRDMQFVAYPCTNDPPDPTTGTVTNLTGAAVQTAPYAVQVCESGDFCFDMVISDPNLPNILDATSNIGSSLPGATFSFTGTNPITCHVCWTAAAGSAGFYPFIVTVDDGACPIPAFQTYVYSITVIPGLFATVQATDESCLGVGDGTATATITTGTGPFQYAWSNGGAGASITAGAGTYTVVITDANGCVSAPGSAVISSNPAPTANAGPDQVACYGSWPLSLQGTMTNATTGSWSGGSGMISGSGASVQYTPSAGEIAAGSVQMTFTATGAAGCPPASDVMTIALSDGSPGAGITATNASCNGGSDGTAAFAPADPSYTYLWNDPAAQTTSTATGLTAGTYTVQVTDDLGCTTSISAVISAPAAIMITNMQVVDESCAGTGDGSVTVTAGGGTPPYQYNWSNGASTATITVGAGSYTVIVTDANGCAPAQATATVNAVAQPNTADAGPDLVVCMNDLPFALQGIVTNAPSGTWSGGAGSFIGSGLSVQYQPSPSEIVGGGVLLYLTTTGVVSCPPDADTVYVTISNSFIGATVTTDPVECAGGNTGSAYFTPANPTFSYLWNDPAAQTTSIATGLSAGTYTVTVTDAFGCDTSMIAVISEPPPVAIMAINATDVTCNGGTNGTVSINATGGTPGYIYQWSANAGGQITPSISMLAAGVYTVTITDANGCTAQANAFVNEPSPITLSAQAPDTVCVNSPVLLTAQAGGGSGSYTIGWSGIGTGSSITHSFSSSQTVTVTVMDGAGCMGPTISLPIYVLDLSTATLNAYGDTTVCPGGSAVVGAMLTGYPSMVSITWPELGMFGTGPFTIPVTASETLQVVVTDACGNSISDLVQIQLETPPVITLPAVIATGCAPLTVQMPDLMLGGPLTYLWNFGDGGTSSGVAPLHTFAAGSYLVTLTITTPVGCTSTSNPGSVVVYPNPTAEFTADPWTTDADNSEITFTDLSGGSVIDWNWDMGDGNSSASQSPIHTYLNIGTFPVTLQITDVNGCTDEVTHVVTITPLYDIVIPNAFTPDPLGGNGGGYDPSDLSNNVFYPFVRFVKDFKLRIYDRWGELVFESDDILRGWDGYYRGQLGQQDVYAVQVWVRFIDDREIQRLSDLTLFR